MQDFHCRSETMSILLSDADGFYHFLGHTVVRDRMTIYFEYLNERPLLKLVLNTCFGVNLDGVKAITFDFS